MSDILLTASMASSGPDPLRSTASRISERGLCWIGQPAASNRIRRPASPAADTRLMFFGSDEDGTPLEVIAVETEERRLLVIHVMQLRSQLRPLYEEARRWQERTDIP